MARGRVLDVDQVQPRIHEGGHPPIEEIDDYPSGGSRLIIVRADRCGRIDDHDRYAFTRRLERFLLGQKLRSLVRADHVSQRHRRVLAPGFAVRDADSTDRAGMDDSADFAAMRRGKHVARALDVGGIHRRRIEDPQPVVRGDMIDLVASARRLLHCRGIAQVTPGELARQTFERAQVRPLAHHRAHRRSTREQRAHHVASHEAVGARDQSDSRGHTLQTVTGSPTRPAMAAAAACPDVTALSIVAGNPV